MHNENILISGAGIAGPALAHWLRRYGFRPTIVERAPALREGGQAVDFRGTAHLTVLRRMGILDEVRRRQTERTKMVVIDAAGRPRVALPAEFAGGEVEILRGDLAALLYDLTRDDTEYVFGDWITSLTETADGVRVTFNDAPPRTFDLVVGADGLHSGVRALAFGPETGFRRFLDHYIAGFSVPDELRTPGEVRMYSEPGRMVSPGLVVFASPELDYDRHDVAQQKKLVADACHGMGWRAPEIIEAMWAAPDFFFDPIAQIHIDRFSAGRIALLGDAGYGATLGGLGAGQALVTAYVLAGELAAAGGDHRTAYARYEHQIKDFARGCQKIAGNAGPFMAPATPAKIRQRNLMYRVLSLPGMAKPFNKITTKAANAIRLADYSRFLR
ncbi:FAD-dependent monooxygenase [Saccharopolyspora shandongensis]|uniref:FAD-dependent monooxygenase n=1 Tax=Saccharopolyspora shandongensis TaxID=418495 RepID=UPI0034410FBF